METVKSQGILKSVQSTAKANVNGTLYRTVTIEMNGKDYFGKIWEKSFQNGVTIGATYTTELQLDGDTVWITLLNGSSAEIANASDFAHLFSGLTV